jgi:Flp pilus assembly protein TadG
MVFARLMWPAARDLRSIRLLRRFRRNRSGLAAVEFAMVAPPFLFLLFAMIEVALVFFASQVLETGTANAARQVLTGQASAQNFNQAAFKSAVCKTTDALMNCDGISVDVRSPSSFSGSDMSRPISNGAINTGGMQYNATSGGDIVVVRVLYEWPVMMPTFGLVIGDLKNGKRSLMATAVFRNEPFK